MYINPKHSIDTKYTRILTHKYIIISYLSTYSTQLEVLNNRNVQSTIISRNTVIRSNSIATKYINVLQSIYAEDYISREI